MSIKNFLPNNEINVYLTCGKRLGPVTIDYVDPESQEVFFQKNKWEIDSLNPYDYMINGTTDIYRVVFIGQPRIDATSVHIPFVHSRTNMAEMIHTFRRMRWADDVEVDLVKKHGSSHQKAFVHFFGPSDEFMDIYSYLKKKGEHPRQIRVYHNDRGNYWNLTKIDDAPRRSVIKPIIVNFDTDSEDED